MKLFEYAEVALWPPPTCDEELIDQLREALGIALTFIQSDAARTLSAEWMGTESVIRHALAAYPSGAPALTAADHVLTIEFDGEYEYLNIRCRLKGPERPCAVIDCPVDHEDVTRDCIGAHGAVAKDECWAEEWLTAGGRECLAADSLDPIEIPVTVHFDDGVVVENA